MSLAADLQSPKKDLDSFANVTMRILDYLPNVVTGKNEYRGYSVLSSESAGTKKYIRPIKNSLFIYDSNIFTDGYKAFIIILEKLKRGSRNFNDKEIETINKVVYTIQQGIGVGLDLLVNPNSARKHVGNRFEELIRLIIEKIGVSNKKIVLNIPYNTDEGIKSYKCETDLVFSPYNKVKSGTKKIDQREVVVSLKTTSKDRMGKIFIDKLLMQKFCKQEVKVIGVFLNDVQRKEDNNISFTLLSGLFMVYTEFLTKLEGVYFLDLPPKAIEPPYSNHIFPFSKFLVEDIWELMN